MPVPTLLTGTIVASIASTASNKIRVAFDSEKQSSFSQANTPIYNHPAGYKNTSGVSSNIISINLFSM